MKRILPLFASLVLLTLLFSNCRDVNDLSYNTVMNRVTGKWTIEEVRLKDNKRLFSTDITETYKGFTFDFKYDNTLVVHNPKEDKMLYGTWYLDENWVWDEDENEYDVEYQISSVVYDLSDTTQYRHMIWKDLKVNNSKLNAIENRMSDDGKRHKYSFKLRR